MATHADGFRVERGAGADKASPLRSELGAPMVSLGVATGADRDDVLENEHGYSFPVKGRGTSSVFGFSEDGGLLERRHRDDVVCVADLRRLKGVGAAKLIERAQRLFERFVPGALLAVVFDDAERFQMMQRAVNVEDREEARAIAFGIPPGVVGDRERERWA